jgi:hypothetical protein
MLKINKHIIFFTTQTGPTFYAPPSKCRCPPRRRKIEWVKKLSPDSHLATLDVQQMGGQSPKSGSAAGLHLAYLLPKQFPNRSKSVDSARGMTQDVSIAWHALERSGTLCNAVERSGSACCSNAEVRDRNSTRSQVWCHEQIGDSMIPSGTDRSRAAHQ